MAKFYSQLDETLQSFIYEQKLFLLRRSFSDKPLYRKDFVESIKQDVQKHEKLFVFIGIRFICLSDFCLGNE